MPIVEMPNGDRVQFPDDMPKEQIRGLIASKFPGVAQGESQPYRDTMAELSKRTQNPNYGAYQEMSTIGKMTQALDDQARLFATGATFGLADRAAALGGSEETYAKNLEYERAKTNAARERAGGAGLAMDVIGSAVVPVAAAGRGGTLMGKFGSAGAKGIKGVGARAGLAAVEGAGYGAAQAAGRGEDVSQGAAFGAVGGGLGSMAGDAIGAGVKGASSLMNKVAGKTKPIPEMASLRNAASKAYQRADDAGVMIRPEPMKRLNAAIQDDLAEFGYDPALQARIKPVLDRLNSAGEGNITLKGVDLIRRVANNARMSDAADERKLGNMIISRIDDFVDSLGKTDVVAGDPVKGTSALNQARGLWRRIAKNEEFTTAVRKAELRAASTGSGGNTENAIRQNLRRIVEKGRGWTPDEMSALEEIVRGNPTQNILRLAGKLSPSGNGLMAALGVGGAMVNPAIGAASLGGMGAKALADRSVMRGVQALDELIRAGGTQEALQAFKGTLRSLSQSQREAIVATAFGTPGAIARYPSEK